MKDPLHGLRGAAVFGRGQKYVVTSESRAAYGTVRTPPYLVLPRSASDEELGAAVIRAVESFTLMVEPLSDELGRRSCTSTSNGKWSAQPWGRQRGYWVPFNEDTYLKLNAPSARDVGAAVRSALVTLRGRPRRTQ